MNGSHKLKDVDYDSTEQMREQLNNILHLQLKVGQVLVANANIIHRGGPNSDYRNLLGTDSNFQENELKMPGMRNLSIHGYLTQKGEKMMKLIQKIISLSLKFLYRKGKKLAM